MRLRTLNSVLLALFIGATLAIAGCANSGGSSNNTNNFNNTTSNNTHPDCPASEESGYWLVPIGSVSFDIPIGGTVNLKAMVVRAIAEETENYEDGLAAYYPVTYEIISATTGGTLSVTDTATNEAGMVSAEFTADSAGEYKVLLSGEGVCSRQYTINVLNTLANLEALSTNTTLTYTNRRISVGVRAFNMVAGQGELPLASKAVTFELTTNGSGSTLEDISGTTGSTITVNTDVGGIATLFLRTGSTAFNANIRATLDGMSVEPVTIAVQVQDSGTGGPCVNNIDCPSDAPVCVEGTCIEVTPGGSCSTDDDCIAPYTCQEDTCQPPSNGERCNLLSTANQCPSGKVCIGGYCVDEPGACTNNDDCPAGFMCENGICVGDGGEDDCYNVGCPDPNDVCIAGTCVNPADCELQDSPTRLGGTWNFDSMLHLREAVGPFLGGILGASEVLRDVILGTFSINGVPGWLMSIVNDLLQDLIDEYVPPWAQSLIVALGDVSDIVDDMRVLHTVNLVPMGNDEYYGTQIWDLVEFEYRGNYVSSPPEDVLDFQVIPQDFTSREICGTFYIDRYYVENVVGGLVAWAIDVVVTGVTCSSDGIGCYYSLEDALVDLIDCDSIATAIDDLVYSMFDWAPSVYDPIYDVCDSQKQNAIDSVLQALQNITTSLNLLSLEAVSPIVDDTHLSPGRWYGTLAGGNFNGDFEAVKQ